MERGNSHCYVESSFFTNQPGVYKPTALPSGAVQGAQYPAGTRGDIQAVTHIMILHIGAGALPGLAGHDLHELHILLLHIFSIFFAFFFLHFLHIKFAAYWFGPLHIFCIFFAY